MTDGTLGGRRLRLDLLGVGLLRAQIGYRCTGENIGDRERALEKDVQHRVQVRA